MKQKIKNLIKKNQKIFKLISIIRMITNSSMRKSFGKRKKYPKVIQLPITYKCNSKCVMCNIWKMSSKNEASLDEFKKFMKDPLFKKVESVGINGGEPSLVKNLEKYACEILNLPSLKHLNIISHGFNQELLLSNLIKIYKMCKEKNIPFHVSISLDGIGEIHNRVRGKKNIFNKTISTIDEIKQNQHLYCDSFDIGCTLVKQNIDYLIEIDVFAKIKNYNLKYRLGINNRRIESHKINKNYSVLDDPFNQNAKEFFHYKMLNSQTLNEKFKYFSILYWLNNTVKKRLLGCLWQEEGVTLDARGDLYYCAVASHSLGNLKDQKGEDIFFDKENINYRYNLIKDECDKCIHDYAGTPQTKNLLLFLKEMIKERFAMKIYKIKAKFL